jgi:type IV secretion system protein TrbE
MAPIYSEYLPKFRWRVAHLSDKIPWRILAAPGVMLHKQTNALQRTYAIRGPDLSFETKEAQGATMLAFNDVLKRPGASWMFHSEAQRVRVTEYPDGPWDNIVAQLIDEDRRHHLIENPGSRETRYFLTATWKPPHRSAQRMAPLIVKNAQQTTAQVSEEGIRQRSLDYFLDQSDYLMSLLRGLLARSQRLTTDETLTYLHSTVSDRWHPVKCPVFPIDLDVRLCDSPYRGGWYPQLGDWHLRTFSVMSYPAASVAGMVKALEHKDIDYRWVVRWIAEDKHVQGKLLQKTEKAWVGQERSFMDRISENFTGRAERVKNTDATNKAEQVDAARQEVGADMVAFGQFTGTVTTWDTDPEVADDKILELMHVFEAAGFVVTKEKEHATAAWLSSHPGNRVDSVRRTPQKSLTWAHLCPGIQSAWNGPTYDEHLNSRPWFLAHSEGNTIFRVVNHVLDNGHHLVIGPTRSGKSTLAGLMVAQWLLPGRRVYWFDLDGSARCLTLCLGGHWYDLGGGGVAFQPLRDIDDPTERAWAINWLLDRLEEAKIPRDADVQRYLSSTLKTLGQAPVSKRTISELITVMAEQSHGTELRAKAGRIDAQGIAHPDQELKDLVALHRRVQTALRPYCRDGEYAWLLDANHDDLQEGPLHTFEQKTLLTMPRLVGPALSYIFHRLEQRFDTKYPTLIPMDDAAITWAIPDYQENGKKWMTTTAKRNVSLGFFTHSLTQVFESPLGSLLQESCSSVFAMPNPQAKTPRIARIYQDLGYNDMEISIIGRMQPQRECYYKAELLGSQRFRLDLSPFILSMIARNRAEDHERMDKILHEHGRDDFAAAWFRSEGFEAEAMRVEQWQRGQRHAAD